MGTISILARAVDDSANLGVASAPRGAVVNCPCSVLGDTVPSVAATDQATGQELGLRVTATANGFITGVRFYRGQGNDGPHTGSLWSAAGRRLASVDFTAETPTGWQTAAFATPVAVTAGQTYLVSYTAPQGHFAVVAGFFAAAGITAGPLTAAGGYGTPPAGVFGAPGTFPGSSYHQNNYFVDAVFSTTRS
jgi:hypothetical protein